ncbi:MAG: PASTA domain-containing protein [Bifidobacteriaceae bacterium]|nr:PASTA domain-containing protein [Bifidobacteriaceae bacterium]
MARSVHDPLIGVTIDGRYRITARIARGGMATVYRANDLRLDRAVALKVLHPHLAEGQEFIDRFRREARAAAKLIHPGIVAVYDQGTWGESPYLVMELVDGPNLRTVLARAGLPPLGKALDLMAGVLDALGAAHLAGFVHRDIKPENILVSGKGQVKVADFGLARAVSEVTAASSGVVLGTVAYLSPELVAQGVADPRTDVYAAGVVLFELLTGVQPFTGDAPIQVAFQHVHGDFPKPSSRVDWLPPQIDDLVAALTAKDPDDRPPNAAAAQQMVKAARFALAPELAAKAPALPPDAALDEDDDDPPPPPPSPGRHAAVLPDDGPPSEEILAPTSTLAPGAQLPDDGATDPLPGGPPARQRHRTGGTRALPLAVIPPKPASGAADGPARPALTKATTATPVPPPKKKSHWLRNFFITLLVLLLAAGGAVAAWYYQDGPGAKVTVPTLKGLSQEDAEGALVPLELNPRITSEYSDTVAAGTVMSAAPAPGTEVDKQTYVDMVVSLGKEYKVIPKTGVTDVTVAKARAAIEAAGLDGLVTENEEYMTKVAAGTVTAIDPAPGTTVEHDAPIVLTVSLGPEPVIAPNLTGMLLEDAQDVSAPYDLTVIQVTEDYSETVPRYQIISQEPEANAQMHRGDTIEVVVSLGMPRVQVPETARMTYEEAVEALESVGLVAAKSTPYGDFFHLVRESDPKAGTWVDKYSTVTLVVM